MDEHIICCSPREYFKIRVKEVNMPHMFTNHPRLHNLTRGRKDLKSQFLWETINAVFYKIGGGIVGNICFFPKFEAYADLGAWIFFVGSLNYLVVTFHDFLEGKHFRWTSNHHSLKKVSNIQLLRVICRERSCLPLAVSFFFPPWGGSTLAPGHL